MSRFWLVALALCLATSPATAQTKPQPPEGTKPPSEPSPSTRPPDQGESGPLRPYTAIFGGATVEPRASNGTRVNASLFGAWDNNLLSDFLGPATDLQISGFYSNFTGDFTYTRSTPRSQVSVLGSAGARYYAELGRIVASDYRGGFGVTLRPSSRSTLAANQVFGYTPIFLFGLFADALPTLLPSAQAPNTAFAVNDDRAILIDSSVSYDHRLTARDVFSASAAYRRSHFVVVTPRGTDVISADAGGGFRRQINPSIDLRAEYRYRGAEFRGADPTAAVIQQPTQHDINFGVAFRTARSELRRTYYKLDTGTALVSGPTVDNQAVVSRQFRVIGDLTVARQMGRTWLMAGAFKRGTGFVQGLTAPVFSDAVSLTLTGFFNQRVDFLSSVSYTNGEPTAVGLVANFKTTSATARARYALGSRAAITTEYVFYDYDFSQVASLAAGLSSPRARRSTIRVGMTLWAPLGR